MSDQAGFNAALSDPNDHHARAVMADRLQDSGHDAHAERLRWWAGAVAHLLQHPHASKSFAFGVRDLPDWVRTAGANHQDWRQVKGDKEGDKELAAVHAHNERMALGLAEPDSAIAAPVIRRAMARFSNDTQARNAMLAYVAAQSNHPNAHVLDTIHGQTLESLAEYASRHPVPNTERLPPVKLSRVGDWVKSWFGKKEAVRSAKDGLVHTHAADPTAAYAEHNAISQAMRLLGAQNHADPGHVALHADAMAKIIKEKPDLPIVKNYLDKARVVGGTAGPELTEAAKPLVSAANMLLHVAGKAQRFVKPQNETLPRPLPSSTAEPEVASAAAPQPFELVDEPEPTEDRHTAIMRMKKAGADQEAIIDHIMKAHGAPNRKAAQASIRAAFARAIALHQKAKQGKGPTKLAAYAGGPINTSHTTGRVAAKDPLTGAEHGFHGGIQGTALAYHLRQIQQEHPSLQAATEAALTGRAHGPTAAQDDPFAVIGKELAKNNHPLASAYNWANVADGLRQDAKVQAFVRQHVLHPNGLSDLRYWDRARNQFGRGTHKQAEEFWKRFEAANLGITREQAVESLARLSERALDRQYLQSVKGKTGHQEWRAVMGEQPHSEHLRFSREEWSNG